MNRTDGITERSIVTQAYVWLALPVLLFLGFWFRPLIAVPMVALLLFSLYRILIFESKSLHTDGYEDVGRRQRNLLILLLIVCYVAICGIGGIVAQLPDDHEYRNGVFYHLARHDWPVAYQRSDGEVHILCYYFAFWLPAAVISKITGTILAGDLAQIAYAAWGTWIAMNFMFSNNKGKVKWAVPVVFVLFNAWDLITALIFSDEPMDFWNNPRLPVFLWPSTACYDYGSSANSIIYNFIYNQGIPCWVVLTLLLHERCKSGRMMLVYGFLPVFAPIPSLALAPYVAWQMIKNIKRVRTPANFAGLFTALLAAIFFLQNSRGGSLHPTGAPMQVLATMGMAVLYYAVSLVPFLPFIWRYVKRSGLYWSVLAMAVLGSGFKLGNSCDLAWRISLPVILLTCYYLCLRGANLRRMTKWWRRTFLFVMAVGSLSSLYDIGYTLLLERKVIRGEWPRKYEFMMEHLDSKKYNGNYYNFIAEDQDCLYRRWLSPKSIATGRRALPSAEVPKESHEDPEQNGDETDPREHNNTVENALER